MATNTFRPTALRTGVSATVVTPTPDQGASVVNQQTVYEWLDYSTQWKTNPPFLKGSAGSLIEGLRVSGGEERPRILRGFIRRAQYAVNDDASMSRLYFMYNPESISRDYMNYLDQGALDPFNTVFQSGNLVAPPSMLNFSFELFFDRQEEAMAANNRGVMVDMDYFDLVVRNVKPGGSSANNTLPDNGIMMVNPRDITVVFSPEITVQGRPLNASVTYERFTHKMVPTRVRINIQMRVVYFGPQREITTFVPETVRAMESIFFDTKMEPKRYNFQYEPLVFEGNNESYGSNNLSEEGDAESSGSTNVDIDDAITDQPIPTGLDAAEKAAINLNREAASHGWRRAQATQNVFDGNTVTQYGGDTRRTPLWKYVDCSSFVWGCYAELGLSNSLGWEKWPTTPNPSQDVNESTSGFAGGSGVHPASTQNMIDGFGSGNTCRRILGFGGEGVSQAAVAEKCTSGDLILRKKTASRPGHVAFIWTIEGGTVKLMHAGSPSMDVDVSGWAADYTHVVRPYPKLG